MLIKMYFAAGRLFQLLYEIRNPLCAYGEGSQKPTPLYEYLRRIAVLNLDQIQIASPVGSVAWTDGEWYFNWFAITAKYCSFTCIAFCVSRELKRVDAVKMPKEENN